MAKVRVRVRVEVRVRVRARLRVTVADQVRSSSLLCHSGWSEVAGTVTAYGRDA
jgi:hypothetical protein